MDNARYLSMLSSFGNISRSHCRDTFGLISGSFYSDIPVLSPDMTYRYPVLEEHMQYIGPDMWECKYCGRLNPINIYECLGCAHGRTK